jgi:hypothetical protein
MAVVTIDRWQQNGKDGVTWEAKKVGDISWFDWRFNSSEQHDTPTLIDDFLCIKEFYLGFFFFFFVQQALEWRCLAGSGLHQLWQCRLNNR